MPARRRTGIPDAPIPAPRSLIPWPKHLESCRRAADRAADVNVVTRPAPPRVSQRRGATSPPAVTSTTSRAIGARDISADHRDAVASREGRQSIHKIFDVRHQPRAGQHQREQRPAGRRRHRRQVTQIDRERLVPDVRRGRKGAREVHPFDDGVGRNDQPFVPARRQHRRIVSRSHEDRRGRAGQASQDSRQKGVFTELDNVIRLPTAPKIRDSRFAVWGGSLNLR